MRINYVIAVWGGPRRSDDDRAIADRTFFLRRHLECLEDTRHSLAAITIVVPLSSDEPSDFTAYVDQLRGRYTVIRRPNIGYSYGSFVEAYQQTRDSFDAFIFIEDDYVFVQHHFDWHLWNLALDMQADLVCGAVLPFCRPGLQPVMHPGIAVSFCTTLAMDAWAAQPQLPNAGDVAVDAHVGYQGAEAWQVRWGAGLRITDWLDRFAAPFWNSSREVYWYGNRDALPLIMPLHAFDRWVTRMAPDRSWQTQMRWCSP